MKRVLFITGNRLGDVVISTGVLRALQKRYPDALFTIVCGPVAASLFNDWPNIERVIHMEKRRYDTHWPRLWWRCAGTRWHHVVDLRGSLLAWLLLARARSVSRGGRRAGLRLMHHRALLRCGDDAQPGVFTNDRSRAEAAQHLTEDRKWIALAPTANWKGKIWPASSFVALAKRLVERSFSVAIFYGPGGYEAECVAPVLAALAGQATDVGGDRPLPDVVALLQRCHAFVGNDSGLMHLAAAAGIPTLGLFGPSRASEYAPSGPKATYLAGQGPEGRAPIESISVDAVYNATCDLLGQS